MRIAINHDTCQHSSWFSDQCLAATLRDPLAHQHFCTTEVFDDNLPELTVDLTLDGQVYTLVLHNEEEIEAAAGEGYEAFLRDRITVTA